MNKEENSAAKTIALEHLGVIAARIKSSLLKFKPERGLDTLPKQLDEVCLRAEIS